MFIFHRPITLSLALLHLCFMSSLGVSCSLSECISVSSGALPPKCHCTNTKHQVHKLTAPNWNVKYISIHENPRVFIWQREGEPNGKANIQLWSPSEKIYARLVSSWSQRKFKWKKFFSSSTTSKRAATLFCMGNRKELRQWFYLPSVLIMGAVKIIRQ